MIRQIMTLATLCWMVAGCADEVIDRNGGKGEGRLLLTGIEVICCQRRTDEGFAGGRRDSHRLRFYDNDRLCRYG